MLRGAFLSGGDFMRNHVSGLQSLFGLDGGSTAMRENSPSHSPHLPPQLLPPQLIEASTSGNIFTTGFNWWRQLLAADLYHGLNCPGPVLEYIPADGALARMIPETAPYRNAAAEERLPDEYFSVIFAIESLANESQSNEEHFAVTLSRLFAALQPGGYLIMSGPTGLLPRNVLKWIAGFAPRRVVTTIYDIEYVAKAHGMQVRGQDLPGAYLPLSRLSVWQKRCPGKISTPPG